MNEICYIGHPTQLHRIEEHRLVGGKGDGMRLIEVDNGRGLALTISADRAGDLSRVSYKGSNIGFFAPSGYVAPQFYDPVGAGFLKSFTAGFLTTCGLTAVGSPCEDDGEQLPLHGTISHIPAENLAYFEEDGELVVKLTMRDASLFARKLLLNREYRISIADATVKITDEVTNFGMSESPYMILYHFNLGYPLLSPTSRLEIPASDIKPRNSRAAEGLNSALEITEPQESFEEQCYYHELTEGRVKLTNPTLGIAMEMSFDLAELPFFTQWKLMQAGEYVMGLEPGNCNPDGRAAMRESGKLRFLKPGESARQVISIKFTEEK